MQGFTITENITNSAEIELKNFGFLVFHLPDELLYEQVERGLSYN